MVGEQKEELKTLSAWVLQYPIIHGLQPKKRQPSYLIKNNGVPSKCKQQY